MATLTPTLTLTSDAASASTDALSLSVNDSLTIGPTIIGPARSAILHTGPTNIRTSSDATVTHIYLKNMDATNVVNVKTDAGVTFSTLGPGEFAFFPLTGSTGCEMQANAATCIVEYALWTKA